MTPRERWTVFPLLLLALGVSLRDKMTGQTSTLREIKGPKMVVDLVDGRLQGSRLQAGEIRAEDLLGNNIDGKVIRCRRLIVDEIHCGSLSVINGKGQPLVSINGEIRDGHADANASGRVDVFGADGKGKSSLFVGHGGGCLKLSAGDDSLSFVLGHFAEGRASGLVAASGDKTAALVPLVVRPLPVVRRANGPPEPAEE